jgi:hypothetical protein
MSIWLLSKSLAKCLPNIRPVKSMLLEDLNELVSPRRENCTKILKQSVELRLHQIGSSVSLLVYRAATIWRSSSMFPRPPRRLAVESTVPALILHMKCYALNNTENTFLYYM